jgi:nucleotide-binding universal stress UspA family protein
MYRFKHILSELNLDEADQAVAQYTSLVTHLAKPSELIFSHVKDHIHAREELLIDDDIFLPSQEEVASEKINKTISTDYNGYAETKTEVLVKEGHQLKSLLAQIKEHDIDLIIVGREPHTPVSRKLPVKLARKAPCSILIVPEYAKAKITSIVVPTDFSHHAKDAVEMAIEFAVATKLVSITLLHLFRLPSGYSKNGKGEEEFCDIMKQNAKESYEDFIEDIDFRGIEVVCHITHDEHLAHGILEEIKFQGSDLIIVGAQGRDAGAGVLLGSITEDMIAYSPVPILAVKDKGRGMSFYEAILRL